MKMRIKQISLFTLTIILLSVFSITINNAIAKDIQHNKTITIKLNSMQCDMCVEKVTDAIKSVEGVEKVTVDLDKKSATVTYNADLTNKKAIEKAITSAGYDANKKPADADAYENLSSCCKNK